MDPYGDDHDDPRQATYHQARMEAPISSKIFSEQGCGSMLLVNEAFANWKIWWTYGENMVKIWWFMVINGD